MTAVHPFKPDGVHAGRATAGFEGGGHGTCHDTCIRVLIVEDDADSALLLSRMLAICGAASDTAANGTEALALFDDKRHPVIVTDICMPVMDGFELVERVRRVRRIDKNTQIIATSANRETDRLISAIGLGFNDYFLKPFEAEKLLWAVKRCADTIGDRKRLEDEQQKFRTVVECLGEGIALKVRTAVSAAGWSGGGDHKYRHQHFPRQRFGNERTGDCIRPGHVCRKESRAQHLPFLGAVLCVPDYRGLTDSITYRSPTRNSPS